MDIKLVILIAGLLIACIGAGIYFFTRGRVYRHSVKVKGIVTGADEVAIKTLDKRGNEVAGTNYITYFSYTADGVEKNSFGYTRKRYAPGQQIELKYDPAKPDDCIEAVQAGTDMKPVAGVMMAAGFIMMLIVLLVK